MKNEELKKMIMDVINATDISVELRRDDIIILADALITEGLTFEPIVIRTVELSDECEKKIHELLKEEEASIEKITHRTFDAERAVQDWANAILDYKYDDATEQAKKELEEEKEDD